MEKQFFQKTFSSLTEKIKKIAGKDKADTREETLYADSSEQDFLEETPPEPKPTKFGEQLTFDMDSRGEPAAPKPQAKAEADPEETSDEGKEESSDACEKILGFNEETGNYLVVHYRKGFEARLIQANPEIKQYYSELKNRLLSYEGTKSRLSWTSDNFHNGRRQVAKINVKTGLLVLYLALDPATLEGTVYRGKDVSDKKKYGDTPFEYKIRTPRKLKWGLELIDRVSDRFGFTLNKAETVDYTKQYAYESTEELVNRGLIKENITEESPASISPELLRRGEESPKREVPPAPKKAEKDPVPAETVAPKAVADHNSGFLVPDPATTALVDIDAVEPNFRPGEIVNLATLKAKQLISDDAQWLKVTSSSGEALPKPIKVEAERFTLDALRAICMSEGDAILLQWRKKN